MRARSPRCAAALPATPVLADGQHGLRDRRRPFGVDEQGRVAAHLGQRRPVGGDHGRAGRHRLQARQPEPLVAGREHERLSAPVEAGEELVGDVAERSQPGQRPGAGELGAGVAGPHELDPVLGERRGAGDERVEVLARVVGRDRQHVRAVQPQRRGGAVRPRGRRRRLPVRTAGRRHRRSRSAAPGQVHRARRAPGARTPTPSRPPPRAAPPRCRPFGAKRDMPASRRPGLGARRRRARRSRFATTPAVPGWRGRRSLVRGGARRAPAGPAAPTHAPPVPSGPTRGA